MSLISRVFITGGSSGIGLALAQYYVKQGQLVAVCGRDEKKFKENVGSDVHKIKFYQVDVSKREEVVAAIKDFGKNGLELVIANAGIGYDKKSRIPNWKKSAEIMETNVLGLMYTVEAALDYMLPQKHGQIVTISSIASYMGLPGVSAYSASKAAVRSLSESYYLDLKSEGIDVTCICPGFIKTPLTESNSHKMPFIMDLAQATKHIVKAIEQKKMIYCFPWQMNMLAHFLMMIPRRWYSALMKIQAFNYSQRRSKK